MEKPNTIGFHGVIINFVPLDSNTDSDHDFEQVNKLLDNDQVLQVDLNSIQTF